MYACFCEVDHDMSDPSQWCEPCRDRYYYSPDYLTDADDPHNDRHAWLIDHYEALAEALR